MELFYSKHVEHWDLDTSMTFLNHGAFGGTPRAVLARQTEFRRQSDAQPLRYFMREHDDLVNKSKQTVGDFLGMNPNNFVFVQNTTQGINTILHSLRPEKGDEWLITSLNYGACVQTFNWYATRYNVQLNTAIIPFPLHNEDEIVERVLAAVTSKTRLVLLDHITSATGIILPIKKIIDRLRDYEIDVLIDGAHAPGMLPLDIESLGAAYYVGNGHKWICSPKGAAIMYVRPDKQRDLLPLQLSHRHDKAVGTPENWSNQFIMTGTMDYSPYFCMATAIDFFENTFENGWSGVRNYNHNLTLQARKLLADALETTLPAPENRIGNLATILLNDDVAPPAYGYNYSEGLQDRLFYEHNIEVPIFYIKNHETGKTAQYLRIACQLYNSLPQYQHLATILLKIRN